jgi:flagella basal body P-ring formation protein FlgA
MRVPASTNELNTAQHGVMGHHARDGVHVEAAKLCRMASGAWHAVCFVLVTMNKLNPLVRFLTSALLSLLILGAAPANSQAVQPLADVIAAATDFVATRLSAQHSSAVNHVTVGTLDQRLRLPTCKDTPQGFTSNDQIAARMTVGVRCLTPAWTVYVLVQIESEMEVLVLRRAIAREGSVTAADVDKHKRLVPGFAANYLTDTAQLAGQHLRTAAAPGTALTTDLLRADTLVKRGQRVTLVAAAGGLEVHAQGEAIADASKSGRVRVLNLSSRKIVEGQVETADRVRISL